MNLNQQQQEAVEHYGSPLVIIAGAGTGKTSVIISKIQHLIKSNNHNPSDILALTFTNKAANEMKERFASLNQQSSTPTFGTFHSFCLRFLKETPKLAELGIAKNFTIIDPQQQKEIIGLIQKNEGSIGRKPKDILNKISQIKQNPYSMHAELLSEAASDIQAMFNPYNQRLKERNCVDFDDLLLITYQILVSFPDELERIQHKFKYVIVDEYQDTNQIQNDITILLAKSHQNICVVGDFDQTIYSWRGAKIENLMSFNNNFPNTVVKKLEINYRSTTEILAAANQLIEHNSNRQPKTLVSDRSGHPKPKQIVCFDEREEAEWIANRIKKLQTENQYNLSDFAILYRTNQQSRAIEESLTFHNIKHHIVGTTAFYQRQEVKTCLAYLHCLNNIDQPIWFEKAMTTPSRGVGKTSIQKLVDFSIKNNLTISNAINHPECPLQNRFIVAIKGFIDLLESIKATNESLENQLKQLLDHVQFNAFLKKTENAQDRMDNVKELQSKLKSITNLAEFLDDVTLFQGNGESEPAGVVKCLTLHLAKGLEFPVVFIPGFEDDILPLRNTDSVEEERRLAYVGITRGKDQVYLLSTYKRTLLGEDWYHNPSVFTKEVENHINIYCTDKAYHIGKAVIFKLDDQQLNYKVLKATTSSKPVIHAQQSSTHVFEPGDVITHATLGTGTIENVSGSGDSMMYDIHFSSGRKKLMAKFAKLNPT
ncbi:MAG: UvrD-helicase domain-containing protein [Candidatus Margulisiibacteriota bacterium]|nr:UvrD-helicase domain-containing protein [Candidatus Margulisiibacteriota bacterium]